MGLWAAIVTMAVSFAVLARSADWLVEGAVGVAQRLKVSAMVKPRRMLEGGRWACPRLRYLSITLLRRETKQRPRIS